MLASIAKGLAFSPHVPQQAQDLIRRMLVEDPGQRITIQQILTHPFVTENFDWSMVSPSAGPKSKGLTKKEQIAQNVTSTPIDANPMGLAESYANPVPNISIPSKEDQKTYGGDLTYQPNVTPIHITVHIPDIPPVSTMSIDGSSNRSPTHSPSAHSNLQGEVYSQNGAMSYQQARPAGFQAFALNPQSVHTLSPERGSQQAFSFQSTQRQSETYSSNFGNPISPFRSSRNMPMTSLGGVLRQSEYSQPQPVGNNLWQDQTSAYMAGPLGPHQALNSNSQGQYQPIGSNGTGILRQSNYLESYNGNPTNPPRNSSHVNATYNNGTNQFSYQHIATPVTTHQR